MWEACVKIRFSKDPKKAEMHRLVAVHLRKVNSMFIILAQSCLNVKRILYFLCENYCMVLFGYAVNCSARIAVSVKTTYAASAPWRH